MTSALNATRSSRLADARTWDGYRSAHFARSTGTLVVVINGPESCTDGPWSTVCDDHDNIVQHETRQVAEYHASNPEGWCEGCMALQAP